MFDKVRQFGSQGAALAKLAVLQKKISNHKIEFENDGVKVVVSGDGKLKDLFVDGENLNKTVKIINEAITSAQKYAADEMKGSMGELSKILGNMPK